MNSITENTMTAAALVEAIKASPKCKVRVWVQLIKFEGMYVAANKRDLIKQLQEHLNVERHITVFYFKAINTWYIG